METQPPTPPPAPSGPSPSGDEMGNDATVITAGSSLTPQSYPEGITSRELAHALRGETLDHFQLQEFIGGGGMGVVFKARDTKLDRTVAVKVLASHRLSSEDLRRRFEVEAQSAARLDHPNIARVYDSGVERGLPYIVFEFIDGINLREAVATRGPLPLTEALFCTYQASLALAHANHRDVIHRDIKPSNILLTPAGETKLIDMGLARLSHSSSDEDLTATGTALGTFDYISPEQASDPRDADIRSDIYSLGCTLFFLLTGRAPFSQGTAVQKLMQHQNQPPPDVREYRREAPESLALLIHSMLAKDPGQRPQDPAEIAAALGQMLQDLGVSLPLTQSAVAWSPRPSADRVWHTWGPWAIAALAILVVIPLVDAIRQSTKSAPGFPALNIPPPSPAASRDSPPADDQAGPQQRASEGPSPITPSVETASPTPVADIPPPNAPDHTIPFQWDAAGESASTEQLSVEVDTPAFWAPSTDISFDDPIGNQTLPQSGGASTPVQRESGAP